MKEDIFEHEIIINAPRDAVFAFMADLGNFDKIHPLIIGLEKLHKDERTGAQFFRITDRLQMGPLKFKIKYTGSLAVTPDGNLLLEGWQFPRVHVHNITTLTAAEGGTRVKEIVTVTTPAMLFGYTFSQAKTAHHAMLAHLKQLLETA